MLPKPGNAFAQQRERERQQKLREASLQKASSLRRQSSKSSVNNSGASMTSHDDVPSTPQTTLNMFLPQTRDVRADTQTSQRSGSYRPSSSRILGQRSATDPTHAASYQHLSALPEPLFNEKQDPSPLTKLVSKLNAKSKEPLQSPAPPTLSGKALEVLGGEVKGKSATKFSSDTVKGLSKLQRDPYPISPSSSEDSDNSSSYPSRFGGPNPTKRWLIENERTSRQSPREPSRIAKEEHKSESIASTLDHSFSEVQDPDVIITNNLQPYSPHAKNEAGLILGNSSLSPTRQGTYATTNAVHVVDQDRIASATGSIVQPSPVTGRHPEPSFLRTPSPLSARAYPYDQRLYDERYLDKDSALTAHTSIQSQLSPTSFYSNYPSPGPWDQAQTHYPSTMPVFSPNAMTFQINSLRPFTVRSNPSEVSSSEASSPPSASPKEDLPDPESTPRGPLKQARISTGSESESETSSNGNVKLSTGSPSHAHPHLTPPGDPPSSSNNNTATGPHLYPRIPSTSLLPSPSPPFHLTTHLERLIVSELASLRTSLKQELTALHTRIDATNKALLLTTKTLDQLSSSMNALSKGVQLDVRSLKEGMGELSAGVRREFDALEGVVRESEQLVKGEIQEKVAELVERYIGPMKEEMSEYHEVKRKALEVVMRGVEGNNNNDSNNAAKMSPGFPMQGSMGAGVGARAMPTPTGRHNPSGSGGSIGVGGGSGGNTSVLGGAWLRQAESMEGRY